MKPIPLATHADVTQVDGLRRWLEGRRVLVVGSAPLPTRKALLFGDEIAIPVNGGISSVDDDVPLWVVNSKAQDKPGALIKPLHQKMLEQCRGRSVGHIVFLRGPKVASEQGTLATLKNLHCRAGSWSVLDKPTKRWIEGELCDRKSDKHPCSSGILTVALALWCRAESVRLDGFSFRPGYHYLPKEKPSSWWRDHIEADKRALVALSKRYGARLCGSLMQEIAA